MIETRTRLAPIPDPIPSAPARALAALCLFLLGLTFGLTVLLMIGAMAA